MQDNKLSQVLGAGQSPFSNYENIVSYPSAIKLKIIAEGYDAMFSKGVFCPRVNTNEHHDVTEILLKAVLNTYNRLIRTNASLRTNMFTVTLSLFIKRKHTFKDIG